MGYSNQQLPKHLYKAIKIISLFAKAKTNTLFQKECKKAVYYINLLFYTLILLPVKATHK